MKEKKEEEEEEEESTKIHPIASQTYISTAGTRRWHHRTCCAGSDWFTALFASGRMCFFQLLNLKKKTHK